MAANEANLEAKKPHPGPSPESFGEHIRALRLKAKLTVEEAASGAGMSVGDWLCMEQADASPTLRMVRPMAAVLAVEPWEVF